MPSWRNKWFVPVVLSLALIGFADAFYLTAKWFQGESVVCRLTSGCDAVLGSAYSTVAGIPVSLIGCVYYLAVILLLVGFWNHQSDKALKLAGRLTAFGLLVSAILVSLQWFVIHAWCGYCIISALINLILAILVWLKLREETKLTV